MTEGSLGNIEQKWGTSETAIWHYEKALLAAESIQWNWAVASISIGKAYAEIHEGELDDADRDLQNALNIYRRIKITKGVVETQIATGVLSLERGQFANARNDLKTAQVEFQTAQGDFNEGLRVLLDPQSGLQGEEELIAEGKRGLADAERNLGLYQQASNHYEDALKAYELHGNKQGQATVLMGQGQLEKTWHHADKKAAALYEMALNLYEDQKLDDRRGQACVFKAEGDLVQRSDPARAREKYREAWNRYRNLGDKAWEELLQPLI